MSFYMAQIEGGIVIARPVAEVVDFAADERRERRFTWRIGSRSQSLET